MKQIILISLSLVFVAFLSKDVNAQEANDKYAEVTLSCSMDCAGCASKVKTQLTYTKGVKSVETDYVKDEVLVKYLKSKTNEKALIASLKEIDYKATVKSDCSKCSSTAKTPCCG
jgi:copper chaperone CopZ